MITAGVGFDDACIDRKALALDETCVQDPPSDCSRPLAWFTRPAYSAERWAELRKARFKDRAFFFSLEVYEASASSVLPPRSRWAQNLLRFARIILGIDVIDAPRSGAVELDYSIFVREKVVCRA